MKFVPSSVSQFAGRQMIVAKKNSPTILFGAGVTGVIASTVLACRATLKLDEVLEEAETKREIASRVREEHSQKYSDEDHESDLVVIKVQTGLAIVKLYAPAIIVGSLSVAALAGSHNILSKRNAALSAAYAALDRGFKEYRARVVDEYGEEKERELRYGSVTETLQEKTENGTKKTLVKHFDPNGTSIYARIFHSGNRNWNNTPEYNLLFLRAQQNYANDLLNSRGHLFLNEVYDTLGIERSTPGQVVGWVKGHGDGYVDFGIFNQDHDRIHKFVIGQEDEILLDFNVDGEVYQLIEGPRFPS